MVKPFIIKNFNIQSIYKLLIYQINKLLIIHQDFKKVDIIHIILNQYN